MRRRLSWLFDVCIRCSGPSCYADWRKRWSLSCQRRWFKLKVYTLIWCSNIIFPVWFAINKPCAVVWINWIVLMCIPTTLSFNEIDNESHPVQLSLFCGHIQYGSTVEYYTVSTTRMMQSKFYFIAFISCLTMGPPVSQKHLKAIMILKSAKGVSFKHCSWRCFNLRLSSDFCTFTQCLEHGKVIQP